MIFWECMIGRLDVAWSLLCLHSDIAKVISKFSKLSKASTSSAQDDLLFLKSIFASHPVCSILRSATGTDDNMLHNEHTRIHSNTVNQWYQWQNLVKDYLSNRNDSLLSTIPELSTLLRALLGDVKYLRSSPCLASNWRQMALYSLLYGNAPISSKNEVSRVIKEAIVSFRNQSRSRNEMYDKSNDISSVFESIANSDFGPLVKHYYESSRYITGNEFTNDVGNNKNSGVAEMANLVNIVMLIVTSQYVYILRHSGAIGKPNIHNENMDFADDIIIETATMLGAINSTPEV